MGDIHVQDKPEGRTVRLTGDLTVENASELKGALLDALERACPLELDMNETRSIDLACVQVLCSARRSFIRAGTGMILAGEVPGPVRTVIESLAVNPKGCDPSCASGCLWREGVGNE